jgi:GTP diphosphokinase / guanosine-3',5'-bis(diphosphate) 3'-diphosphatase
MTNNLALLTEAYKFSAIKHTKQRRKGVLDIPYINHPIEVANLLTHTNSVNDIPLLAAAVLHDTLEDTDTSYEELTDVFGAEISNIVLEVTDDMSLSKERRKQIQVEKAASLSDSAKKIKIADKICNILDIIQTRYHWSDRQKHEYINWSVQVVENCRGIDNNLDNEFDKAISIAKETIGWVDFKIWK